LKLIINSGTHNAEPVTACESYTWHGQTYDTSGTYTYDYSNAFGCLSTDTLHLTVHYGTHLVIDTSACEIFEWHGQTIIDSGMYFHEYVNDDNCPSVDTLRLTIHHSTNNEFDMVACESYEWHGQTYDTSGTYTYEYENEGGCESADILHLTIHYSVERADTLSICVGELPYVYGDTLFEVGTLSGNYVLYDTTIYGCDSTVSLLLQVKQNITTSRAATICESMLPALWEEHLWMAGGTIIDTFPASNGCDSIVTKTLTVGVTTDTTIVDTVVENQLPYILNGKVYTAPGIYHDTTMNMAACDSIITLDLTVFYNVTTTLDSTICDNLLPLFWNGVLFGEADTQSVVLTAATGADSTVVMRLHVNETPQVSISGPIVFCLGDSIELTAVSTPVTAYLWSTGDTTQAVTIHTAGTYTVTVTNEYACTATDSLSVSESFIVNPIASHPFPDMCAGEEYLYEIPGLISTALSVTVDGLWVTAASDTSFLFSPPGTLAHDTAVAYTFHFLNQYGCSYDTTVYSSVYSQSQTVIDTTVCNSFIWNGVTYTQSDTITLHTPNIHGCDSVVTVHLVVNHSSVSYDTLYLVENQLPYYFEPSDTLFAVGSPAAFQFSYAIPIQGECDSTVIEQVYIYMNYFHAFDTLVCSSALPLTWHGHTFTGAGTVTDALLTVHGSDSILVYTVNVDALSATIGSVTHINCYGESTGAATATVTGGVTPLAYQWTNASGSMVSVTTQISNRPAGDYTFTVTDGAGCTVTQTVTLNTLHGQMQPGTISGPEALCYGETLGTVSGTAATGDDCVYQWQISGNGTSWSPATGVNNTQDYTSTEVFSEAFMLRRAWISGACGTLYSNILTINVWPVSSDTIHDAICAGEPYQQHGFDIPATETVGQTELTVVDSLTNSYGCDSLVTLMLDIYPTQETVIQAEVCEGDGYHLDGFSVSASETVGADTLLRILNYQTVEGCDSVVRLEVSVIDTALRIESLTDDFCDEMMAELVVVTNLPDYEWSTGEQLPNITVIAPGVYNVTASQGGCSVTARYVIEPCVIELYLPNAISPSREDGLNDYFGISEYAQRIINMFEISIFNRWGEMVFHSTDKGFRWNGEYRGQIYHQNVYNYVIHYTDSAGRPFRVTGIVTVL
jgi:gliding motility-associated-like protein